MPSGSSHLFLQIIGHILVHEVVEAAGSSFSPLVMIVLTGMLWLLSCREGMITVYVNQSILALRLYGLYGSKKLGYFLLALLCLVFAAEMYIIISDLPESTVVNLGPDLGSDCVLYDTTRMAYMW